MKTALYAGDPAPLLNMLSRHGPCDKTFSEICKHSVGLKNIFGNIKENLVFVFPLYAFQFREVAGIQGHASNGKKNKIRYIQQAYQKKKKKKKENGNKEGECYKIR